MERLAAAAFASIITASSVAAAQSGSGTIAGTVAGDEGNRLAGVTIACTQRQDPVDRTGTTDADGRDAISGLAVEGLCSGCRLPPAAIRRF